MTPDLIFFGIKSLIRLHQQGQRALIEYAADKPLEFPDIKKIRLAEPQDAINRILALPRYAPLTASEPFKSLWEPSGGGHLINEKWIKLSKQDQADKLVSVINAARDDPEALELVNDNDQDAPMGDADTLSGIVVVEQWKPEKRPVSPLGRMALAIVEVALDYVATDPALLNKGKAGEKVVKSFALALGGTLAEKLNAAALGPQSYIVDGLLTAFVGAGLETLRVHSGDLISEQHLAKLIDNALDPVVDAIKGGDALFTVRLQRIVDALAGPAAATAMKTIAGNPGAFLGRNFESSKAAGALVSAVLIGASKDGNVRTTFADHGLLKVLSAALQVAADKPALFIKVGGDNDKVAALVVDLASSLAKELKADVDSLASEMEIDGRIFAAGVAAAAIEAVGRRADAFLLNGQPWDDIGRKLARDVLANLAGVIKGPNRDAFKKAFSQEKLIELGRIVIDGIVANPQFVDGGGTRARELIGAIATAIDDIAKAKKQFLLTADEWLSLARMMTTELIARGPAVMADVDPRPQQVLAALTAIISADKNSVLSSADVATIARVLLAEAARHPLLFGNSTDDLKNVASAVARAMAEDRNLLLAASDWVEILKASAAEASSNPARVFGAGYNTPARSLAADLTGLVVRAITAILAEKPVAPGLVLKGELIREATIGILGAVSGAPERAKKYQLLLGAAVQEVSNFVAQNASRYGGRDWLRLIQILAAAILDGRYDAKLGELQIPGAVIRLIPAPEDADALLAGGA